MMNLVQTSDEYSHFRPCEGVSKEVCIAGVGAFHIYEFYRQEFPELINPEFEELWERFPKDRMKNMMEYGFSNRDQLCRKGIEQWLKILAYECGNLIAKNLPYGGMYLIGGLVTKNYQSIIDNKEYFERALLTKPSHVCKVIREVPFYVVRNNNVGMLGIMGYAKRYLASLQN